MLSQIVGRLAYAGEDRQRDSGGIHQQTARGAVSHTLILGLFPTAVECSALSLAPGDASPRAGLTDLSVSRENAHCWLFFAIRDLNTQLGTDALVHQWPRNLLYAFPPWN